MTYKTYQLLLPNYNKLKIYWKPSQVTKLENNFQIFNNIHLIKSLSWCDFWFGVKRFPFLYIGLGKHTLSHTAVNPYTKSESFYPKPKTSKKWRAMKLLKGLILIWHLWAVVEAVVFGGLLSAGAPSCPFSWDDSLIPLINLKAVRWCALILTWSIRWSAAE